MVEKELEIQQTVKKWYKFLYDKMRVDKRKRRQQGKTMGGKIR